MFVKSASARWMIAAILVAPSAALAQHEHMDIYSTAPGGGDLVLVYDFNKTVDTFQVFCAGGLCLYSTINPAFMAPDAGDDANGHYRLLDGTQVSVVIVDADSKVTLNVDGHRLKNADDTAVLGVMPPIHNHPSWQLVAPEGETGMYPIAYKLHADVGAYGDSPEYHQLLSNLPQAVPTPCPAYPCGGDCDRNGDPTEDEMKAAVELALTGSGVGDCVSVDANGDGVVTVEELVAAELQRIDGCPAPQPATFADIQQTLFSPTCATTTCHDPASKSGNLVLRPDVSYSQLVGVTPQVQAAADAGLLRVTAGDPDRSLLYQKLVGPRPEWGSRMPLNLPCLPPEQIDQVRRWIEQGAVQ